MNRTDKFQVGILSWYIKRLSILSLTNGLILFVLRLRQQGVGHWWTALYNIAVQQRPRSQAAAEYPAGGWEGFHSGKRGAFSFPYARKAVRQCLLDRRMIEWRNREPRSKIHHVPSLLHREIFYQTHFRLPIHNRASSSV